MSQRRLQILGFVPATGVQVRDIHIAPAVASIGESVTFTVGLANEGSTTKQLLVELRVHFVKANGRPSPKVFALKELELQPRGSARLTKTISLAQHTTRTHYPGQHRVEVVVNGRASGAGVFDVVAESRIPYFMIIKRSRHRRHGRSQPSFWAAAGRPRP